MDITDALERVFDGRITPADRAALEQHLLDVLVAEGADALAARLRALPRFGFAVAPLDAAEALTELVSERGGRRIRVTVYAIEDMASISLDVEDLERDAAILDPAQAWFYETWESLLAITDPATVLRLDEAARAVYLVALFEAEIMNGGIGQYLANTGGVFLDPTIEHLQLIGAIRSAEILTEAAQLGADGGNWDQVWKTHAEFLRALDDRFLAAGENLAGLTANCFGSPR